ncbi:MAG: cysteine desulfurase [Gammaproteobacteria bacterium]|nr:cysteine desulfurase [Gammaproteobacteria bacterium]
MATRDRLIYLDSASTTRVAPEVCAVMFEQLDGTRGFANASSQHHEAGRQVAEQIERARSTVARELGCVADEIIFTSGATESINLALRGVALANAQHGRHLITTQIEHKATLACCDSLHDEGFEVTRIAPRHDGRVDPADIANAIRSDTLLISVMHVNNETGVIQPLSEIAAIAEDRGVLLHVDAAQSAGKFHIGLSQIPIDLLSLSAHKIHGPKGIGCLFVRDRPRLRIRPLTFGGAQEFGLRPGTLPTHQIVGLAAALELVSRNRDQDQKQVTRLRAQFVEMLSSRVSLNLHGALDVTSPYILNFSIPGISSDVLINQCAADIAMASGAACSSGTVEPSYVLRAMGLEGDALYGAVRVSFDRYHTPVDINVAVDVITEAVKRIKELVA